MITRWALKLASFLVGIFLFIPVSADELRVGVLLDLTGPGQVWGEQLQRGTEMSLADLKSNPSFKGTEIEVFYEDSKTDPKEAVAAFNRLVSFYKVQAVLGPIWSHEAVAVAAAAKRAKVLFLATGTYENMLDPDNPYFYTICPRADSLEPGFERFLALNPQVNSLSVVCPNIPWGESYIEMVSRAAKTQKVKINLIEYNWEPTPEYRVQAIRARQLNDSSLFVCYDLGTFNKRLREIDYRPQVITTSDIHQRLKNGEITFAEAEGVSYLDWDPGDDFRRRFEERYQTEAFFEPQGAYDGLKSLALAYLNNPDDLLAGLKSVKFTGLAGEVDYTRGQSSNFAKVKLYQISNGKKVRR